MHFKQHSIPLRAVEVAKAEGICLPLSFSNLYICILEVTAEQATTDKKLKKYTSSEQEVPLSFLIMFENTNSKIFNETETRCNPFFLFYKKISPFRKYFLTQQSNSDPTPMTVKQVALINSRINVQSKKVF